MSTEIFPPEKHWVKDTSIWYMWMYRVYKLLLGWLYDGFTSAGPLQGSGANIGAVSVGNYTEIEADGTIQLHGDATFWLDELSPLVGARLENPSSHIVAHVDEGTLTFKDNCDLDDYAVMSVQLNHDWKSNSDIDLHLHWRQTEAAVPNWLAQYRWQVNGANTIINWSNLAGNTTVFTYSGAALFNQMTEFGDIKPPLNYSISDIVQIRLLRDVSNTSGLFVASDPVTGDVDAVSFDFHKECDTLGSRTELAK